MMKINKTYRKSILRTVRANLSHFLAIFSIVALGTGFLSGLMAAPVDMRLSADEYFRTTGLYDIKIQATQGFTDTALDTVRAMEGVQTVMPARDLDLVLTSSEGENITTRMQSIPPDGLPEEAQLNQLTLVEGRLPSAPGEIAVCLTPSFKNTVPAVGDIFTLSSSGNDEVVSDMLPNSFTVVGIVRSAAYFSSEIEYTNAGSGTIGLFACTPDNSFDMDYYTTLYLTVENTDQLNSFSDAYTQTVKDVLDKLDAVKDQQVQARYDEIVHKAQTEIDNAWAEYRKAEAAVEVQFARGKQELADSRKEYEDAKATAEADLADAKEEILDAESEVRKIEKGTWLISDRTKNASFSGYADNANRISAVGKVFPVFFFLVAALVALTTMTRMVEEERGQVGTLKALGYSYQQIAAKYILYASTATLAGSVLGTVVGMQLFPRIILRVYAMYDLPVALPPFNWKFGLLATGAALGCTLLATISACRNILKEQPASLMLPKAPRAGKRIFLEYITPLWRRLQFTHKVTARNLFLYKKRFFMTVLGMAGCTALLVTGFGLHDSIADIVEKQFGEIAHYQMMVSLQDESALSSQDLQTILQDESQINGYLTVCQEDMTVVPAGSGSADKLYLMVPEDIGIMHEYFTFRQRTTGESMSLGDGSVIITEKLAELQNLAVGDDITVQNTDGDMATFTITGISENYVQHYLYTTAEVYREAFGTEPTSNLLLCRLNGNINTPEAEDALSSELLQCRDVAGVQFVRAAAETFSQNLDSVNYIVVVLIVMAGALAVVVLYTLTDINITERTKELATIKVLGFYDREVGSYIYRETAILTLIGTICGLLFGIVMHSSVVRNAEVDIVMFDRSLYLPSFLWAALLTLLFSLVVNAMMYRKLKNISMVESMKAPE